MKRGFDRTRRIADEIQKHLATMLLRDMADERFTRVTIVSVNVTKDLAYAKIYVSVLFDEEDKIQDTVKALNKVAGSLRYNLAKAVNLRVVPELKFIYDSSTAHGFRINDLIDQAMKKEKK